MVNFGEKIKQLREEKGMTQQSLAEKLYVTRQAVSRWECGARYPDLLTAKKIAQILDVSVDELLSGEKLKENIEKEPILVKPAENIMQTVLYAIASTAYFLSSIFGIYSLFPDERLANTPAGQITLTGIGTVIGYIIIFTAVFIGLGLSIKRKLSARITGYIMCVPFANAAAMFLLTYIQMQMKQNGYIELSGWLTDFLIPLFFTVYVLLFFAMENDRLPYGIVLLICVLSVYYIARGMRYVMMYRTDLGMVVTTVHCLGMLATTFLLGYQGYVWNKKKRVGYKK